MIWPATASAPAPRMGRPTITAPGSARMVDDAIGDDALKDALGNLRTPRQLFKFLHRLLEEHCHRHTEDAPKWSVDADTFRTVYSAHLRDIEAFDRGYGHGLIGLPPTRAAVGPFGLFARRFQPPDCGGAATTTSPSVASGLKLSCPLPGIGTLDVGGEEAVRPVLERRRGDRPVAVAVGDGLADVADGGGVRLRPGEEADGRVRRGRAGEG